MLNNRRKDSTFLKVENGKIIELDESKKENWQNIQEQKDNEIKQQKYKKIKEKEIEAEPNKSKKIIKKNSTLLLRIALALIFLPLIIILCLYLYTSFHGANTKLNENINETTVRSVQTKIEETTTDEVKTQEPIETIAEETSKSIFIKKQPLSDMKLNNILVSIDNYNENIYSVFSNTKNNVSDVVYHYGDALLAETEIEKYYDILDSSYETFKSDELLQTEAPNMYLIIEQRYKNAFDMIQDLANNLDMSGETVLNNYITTNNNLLEDQVQAELVFLDNNNIKYDVNGLNIQIKGN